MKHLLAFAMLAISFTAGAVVIRSDVKDARYRVSAAAFPALAGMPGEGQGVLIAPRWVVTAAHATQGYMLMHVKVHGKWRNVSHVYLYPGFKRAYAKVRRASEHPTLKHWPALEAAFAAMHDIALIELVDPVADVKPAALYMASDEQGKVVKIFGRGATGNGKVGQYPNSPHRGELRRAYNRITLAHGQWLDYRFDCGSGALPLEGVIGDGDSGGPVLIESNGHWQLAGLSDWRHWPGDRSDFVAGVCGQVFSNSRISYYAKWINDIIAAHPGSESRKPGTSETTST